MEPRRSPGAGLLRIVRPDSGPPSQRITVKLQVFPCPPAKRMGHVWPTTLLNFYHLFLSLSLSLTLSLSLQTTHCSGLFKDDNVELAAAWLPRQHLIRSTIRNRMRMRRLQTVTDESRVEIHRDAEAR